MHKPYDSATKSLIEARPIDWLALAGFAPRGPVRVVNADLSTITSQADKVILVEDEPAWIANFELQAGRDPYLAYRVLRYNALLTARFRMLTRSLVVLLRPEADFPGLDGRLRLPPSIDFRFGVLKIWELPLDLILKGGLGILPLAPLADLGPASPESVMRDLEKRFRDECQPGQAADLWAATWLLLGLRYDTTTATGLIRGVREMKESSTYQLAVAEGELQGEIRGELREARAFVLRLGRKRFGPPSPTVQALIQALDDRECLEQIGERLLECQSWESAIAQ